VIHLLFDDDAPRARAAIEEARLGLAYDREVLVVDLNDKPGVA
jgi:hypothetical protein